MKNRIAVTSFSPDGFDLYGKTFLKSFIQYVDIPIAVYVEDGSQKLPKDKRIEKRLLWDVPGCRRFVVSAPTAQANYRLDAGKFCRKVYAQLDALEDDSLDEVFWFDADVVMRGHLTGATLSKHVKDVAIAYMGREGFHLCSSFVGYNRQHPDTGTYVYRMHCLYSGGGLYSLKSGLTDCDAMHAAMDGLKTRNICDGNKKAVNTANVFDMCFPGHHKKGNRKYGAKGG